MVPAHIDYISAIILVEFYPHCLEEVVALVLLTGLRVTPCWLPQRFLHGKEESLAAKMVLFSSRLSFHSLGYAFRVMALSPPSWLR